MIIDLLIKTFINRHRSKGIKKAINTLAFEVKLCEQHQKSIGKAKNYSGQTGLKLHLGSGRQLREGWVNIDLLPEADLQLDLREALPFDNNSCLFIYAEHFFEHLDYPKATGHLLTESLRVLAPGGKLSLGVPDTEWPLMAYAGQDTAVPDYFSFVKQNFHPKYCKTKLQHLNYHFRQGEEHKYAWDFETLKLHLEEQGFERIERRSFNPSTDLDFRATGTLYVDAFKPESK